MAGAGKVDKAVFETMAVPRALAAMAVPSVASQLIVLVYSMADTFFIGMVNDPQMVAGASLILPVYNICIALALVPGVGGGSLISRMLGAGRGGDARRASAFSLWLAIALGAAFSVATLAAMDPLLDALGSAGGTKHHAHQYAMWVIVIGAVPTITSITMSNLLRAVGSARQAGFTISLGSVINIALDPVFMFWIFPAGMETAAVGAATAVSNVIVCAHCAVLMAGRAGRGSLAISPRAGLPSRADVRAIFYVGAPSGVATLLFDIDYIVIGRLVSSYGDAALAGIGIVLKAERLPLNIGIGICQGMMPLAAYSFAAGSFERMKRLVSCARNAGLVIGAASVAMYFVLSDQIMAGFIEDAATIAAGRTFLRIRAVATPFMFLCFHLVFFFQAIGKGDTALLLAVVRWAVFNIPMLFVLERAFGLCGVVWSQTAADVLTVAFSYAIYCRHLRHLTSGGE